MTNSALTAESESGADSSLVLAQFVNAACRELGLHHDRSELRRHLHFEATAFPHAAGGAVERAHAQLKTSAISWDARIDLVDLTLKQALGMIRPQAPVAYYWSTLSGLAWVLIVEHRGQKLRVYESASPTQPRWVSKRELARTIGIGGRDIRRFIAVQRQYPCAHIHESDAPGRSLYASLLALLAPDRGDIWVIVVFAVFTGVLALSTPLAVEALVNTVAFGQFVQPVVVLAVMLCIFLAFGAAMRAVQTYVAEIVQRRIFVRLAADIANRLPRVRHDYWRTHYTPEVVNRFFEVVTVQKVTAQLLLDATTLLLQTFVGMAVIAFYHPVFLGFDIFLLLVLVVLIFVLGRGAISTSIEESKHKYATVAWLEELARHPMAFRSGEAGQFATEQSDRRITEYLMARSRHFRILMRQIVASLALQVLASTVLLGLGGWLVIRGELTLGQLVAAELIVTVIVGSFAKIGKHLESFYDVMASVDKLSHLLHMPTEQADGFVLPRLSKGIAVTVHDLITHRDLSGQQLRNVYLNLCPGERAVLFRSPTGLHRNLMTMIGGVDLPESGHVEVDGFDTRRLRPDSVQDQVALLSDVEVFSGTVAENLHLGGQHVIESDLRAALEAVGLLDDIYDLPNGLATPLSTDGRELSNDQLARLMLARAIVSRPRLLLIDGLLDILHDEELVPVTSRLLDVLPRCTIFIATGRYFLADIFEKQFSITADGRLQARLSASTIQLSRSQDAIAATAGKNIA